MGRGLEEVISDGGMTRTGEGRRRRRGGRVRREDEVRVVGKRRERVT